MGASVHPVYPSLKGTPARMKDVPAPVFVEFFQVHAHFLADTSRTPQSLAEPGLELAEASKGRPWPTRPLAFTWKTRGNVEAAYKHCRFRWFQLTQRLRRAKSAFLRHRKSARSIRFLVLHSPRTDEDPPAPRDAVGHSPSDVRLRADASRGPDGTEGPAGDEGETEEAEDSTLRVEELSFTAW
eukprot:s4314_g11.t2